MALTDIACKNAAPREKPWKLADSRGLFLLVMPKGGKLWRFKYRFAGKERQLAIGSYPEVKLGSARDARDRARALLREGIDPSAEKQRRKAVAKLAAIDSVQRLAEHWHELRKPSWTPRYADQVLSRLKQNVFPRIGSLPVKDVTRAHVLDLVRRIEHRGAGEMAARVRMHLSEFFHWAIDAGLTEDNPAERIRRAMAPQRRSRRPAVVTLSEAREVLIKTEKLQRTWWATRLASRLLALTAARPGVVRMAERGEFMLEGKEPIWRVPAAKMKLLEERKRDRAFDFIVPLSHQAVATVKAAIAACPESERWLFPGVRGWRKPISDSTLSQLYLDAGFRDAHVPHGWRATFSTIMNERAGIVGSERDREVIDLMLAHMAEDVEAAYNRAAYMPRRRELAQEWADLLMKGLTGPETLVPQH